MSSPKPEPKQPGFFAELKRRNVYKVAIAYAIVAWLLIQVASILFPTFEAPPWVLKVFVVMVLSGFPVALVLAWAFELTPEGIKRAEEVAPNESIARKTGRKLAFIIIALAVIAAGLFGFQYWRSSARGGGSFAAHSAPHKSIAVLPFANLSNDQENAYFADGVQDEILTRLAKVADLKVISRTSTLRFKSTPENLPEIAKQLGVTNILEGSVQKSNDQVRVNVQLINAAADTHLWAEIYDRKLTDLFAVESEIAKAIAETLKAKLTGTEQTAIASEPTGDTAAHDLYLRGHYFAAKRTGEDLRRAIDFFNQAVAQDANYAQAYSGLAVSYILLPEYSDEPSTNTIPKARVAAEKAIALDSQVAEAHVAMALVYHGAELDLEKAERELRQAVRLDPNYSSAHYFLAILVLNSLGRFDEAITEMKRALELNPLSLILNTNLGYTYIAARRYPEAVRQFHKTLELDASFSYAHQMLGFTLARQGNLDGAEKEFAQVNKLEPMESGGQGLYFLTYINALKGDRAKALELLNEVKAFDEKRHSKYNYGYVLIYIALGNKDEAISWLMRSFEERETGVIGNIGVDPSLDPLKGDPRFEALVKRVVGPKTAK